METVLVIVGWALFALAVLTGLALDLVGLFGNWIILGAVVIASAVTKFERFGVWCLVILAGLAALGEVVEFLSAGMGAVRFGGSKKSALVVLAGCLIGSVVGTAMFPILGTVIGACVGAFAGAVAYECLMTKKGMGHAARVGLGAALGKAAGIIAKLVLGLIMVLVSALFY